jgi:hypothetical protein
LLAATPAHAQFAIAAHATLTLASKWLTNAAIASFTSKYGTVDSLLNAVSAAVGANEKAHWLEAMSDADALRVQILSITKIKGCVQMAVTLDEALPKCTDCVRADTTFVGAASPRIATAIRRVSALLKARGLANLTDDLAELRTLERLRHGVDGGVWSDGLATDDGIETAVNLFDTTMRPAMDYDVARTAVMTAYGFLKHLDELSAAFSKAHFDAAGEMAEETITVYKLLLSDVAKTCGEYHILSGVQRLHLNTP